MNLKQKLDSSPLFILPRAMLVMHQHGKDITLLCGDENKTLDILRYERLPDNEINVQKDPYPIERTENAGLFPFLFIAD